MQYNSYQKVGLDTYPANPQTRPNKASQGSFINDVNDYAVYDDTADKLNFVNIPASILAFEEAFYVILGTPEINRGYIKIAAGDLPCATAQAYIDELVEEGFQVLVAQAIA